MYSRRQNGRVLRPCVRYTCVTYCEMSYTHPSIPPPDVNIQTEDTQEILYYTSPAAVIIPWRLELHFRPGKFDCVQFDSICTE